MKIFISHSIETEDQFILPLFISYLKQEGISGILSRESEMKDTESYVKKEIRDSGAFIGLLLKGCQHNKRVFAELRYALQNSTSCLLLSEETIDPPPFEMDNYITFSRSSIETTLLEIDRKAIAAKQSASNDQSSLIWLLCGSSIRNTLESAFGKPHVNPNFAKSGKLQQIKQPPSIGNEPICPKTTTKGSIFETEVLKILRILGYSIERDKFINACQIDLYGEIKIGVITHRLMVECKNYGMSRKVGKDEIMLFNQTLAAPKTSGIVDKGFMVTTNGYTAEAKVFALANGIDLTTFTELSTQLVYFNQYINQLIRDFEKLPVSKYYIDLSGTETEEYELDITAKRYKPIDKYVDQCLHNPKQGKLALLGNFGVGKSTFCRKYAYDLAVANKKDNTRRIPVLINLRDYDFKFQIQELILNTLQNRHGLNITMPIFQSLQRAGRFIFLLDGFDEMDAKANPEVIRQNVRQILQLAEISENRFLITCRNHFFRNKVQTEVLSDFSILYVPEWGTAELEEYLRKRFHNNWASLIRQISGTHNLLELARTPLFLDMIAESLGKLGENVRRTELYLIYTESWIKDQSVRRGALLHSDERREFVKSLAILLYREQRPSCKFTEFQDILKQCYVRVKSETFKRFDVGDLTQMEYLRVDVQSCTFLTRDTMGNYSFRHLSFMEYFVAVVIAEGIRNADFQHLRDRLLSIGIREFLIDLLLEDLPVDILKKALATSQPSHLRDNLLSIISMTKMEIRTADLGEQAVDSPGDLLKIKFIQNDKRAFDWLYFYNRQQLLLFLKKYDRRVDQESAESIVADAFLLIWEKKDQFDNISDLKKYIYQAAIHFAKQKLRHQRALPMLSFEPNDMPDIPNTVNATANAILSGPILQKAIDELSPKQKAAIDLYLEGKQITQIAADLGLNLSTASVLLIQARQALKKHLAQVC